MARQAVTVYNITSDLSGAELTEDNVKHVKIMLTVDGDVKRVELDVSTDELDTLTALLTDYFAAGEVSTGKVSTGTNTGDAERTAAIRQWAKGCGEGYVFNGKTLPTMGDKGRIPALWIDAYDAWQAVQVADAAKAEDKATEVKSEENGNGTAVAFKAPVTSGRKGK